MRLDDTKPARYWRNILYRLRQAAREAAPTYMRIALASDNMGLRASSTQVQLLGPDGGYKWELLINQEPTIRGIKAAGENAETIEALTETGADVKKTAEL